MSIGYEVRDGIAVLTMDDGKVNAMAMAFFDELNAVLDRAEEEKPGPVVITGRPGVFSAGLNLKLLPTLPPDEFRRTMLAFGRTMLRVFGFPLPTVAAIPGHAIAGGGMLALACDLRVMTEGPFRLQLNETAIGLTLPSWAIAIAHSGIPGRWHTEAILHARPYTASEAHERGIVDVAARPERLLAEALALAEPLKALDQRAYAGSKERHRALEVQFVTALLESEVAALPTRATVA
jgi:enoyl-CoA hydratase